MGVRTLLRTTLLLAATLCGINQARAQTWNGTTDANWGTASNWAGGVLPATTGTVNFGTSANFNISLGGVIRSVRNVNFNGTSTAFNLGTGTLDITNDGTNPGVITQTNTVTTVNTISAGLRFSGLGAFAPGLQITNNSTSNLAITGAISNLDPLTSGANLTFTGTGTKSLGAISHTGEFRLENNGAGLVTINGNITTASANGPLAFQGSGGFTISSTGRINTGATVDIVKDGTGTLTINSASNTAATASFTVTQGTVNLLANATDPGALTGNGAGGTGLFTTTKFFNVNAGSTLQLNGSWVTGNGYNNTFSIGGTLTTGNSQNYINNVSFAKGSTFNSTGGNFIRVAGFTAQPTWNFETGVGTTTISTRVEIATGAGSGATGDLILNAVDPDDVAFTTPVANFTGVIANSTFGGTSGGIIKNGVGTIQFSNAANTYSGTTVINVGALRAGAAGAFSSASAFSLADDASALLLLNNFSQTIAGLSGGGAVGGNVQLGSGTLNVNTSLTQTYSGIISGTGGFTKNGTGNLTLGNAANTYTGATNINGGTLTVGTLANGGANSSIGASANTAANLQFNGGILAYTGGSIATNRAFTINAGGGTFNVTTAATVLTISGNGAGTGNLTKTGPGVLLLTGANAYGGTTSVTGGILRIGTAANRLPTTTSVNLSNTAGVSLDLNSQNQSITALTGGGATGGNVTLGSGVLTLSASAGTFAGVISGTGGVTINGSSSTTFSATTSSYTGVTTLSGTGTLVVANLTDGGVNSSIGAATSAAANLLLGGGYTLSYPGATTSFNRAITFNSGTGIIDVSTAASILTSSGAHTGAGNLSKTGAGTLVLSGASNYSGSTSVTNGVLRISGGNDRLPVGSTLNLTNAAGVSFDLNNNSQTLGGLTGGGATGGNITLGSGTLTLNTAVANTYAGAISGSGNVTMSGGSTQTLTNTASSYTGITRINNGVLSIPTIANGGANSPIGASTSAGTNLVLNGGTLQYTGATATTDRGFSLGASGGSIEVTNAASNLTMNGGVAAGAGGLNKTGAGTLTLGGTVTTSGAINVNAGTLNVSGTLAGSSVTASTAGATVTGTGTINSNLAISNNAILAPGNGIGTINVGAGTTTTWGANGQYNIEYNQVSGTYTPGTTHDFLNSAGALNVTAPFRLNMIFTGTHPTIPPTAQSIVIATFSGTAPTINTADFTISGDIFTGSSFTVSAVGNNVVLNFVPVPEPTTILGLSALGFGLIRTVRRRMKKVA